MKSSKLMMALLALASLLLCVKFFLHVGGFIVVFALLAISCVISIIPFGELKAIRSEISLEESDGGEVLKKNDEERKTATCMMWLGMALPVLMMGALFKIMHWPGSNIMLLVGMVATLLMSIALVYVSINSKKNPLAKWVAVVAAVFAVVWGTDETYYRLDLLKFRDFSPCKEFIEEARDQPTEENVRRMISEKIKVSSCDFDTTRYARFVALENEARTMVEQDEHGKLLLVVGDGYMPQVLHVTGCQVVMIPLHQYASSEVEEEDVLYVVSSCGQVKEILLGAGVPEQNIVMVE